MPQTDAITECPGCRGKGSTIGFVHRGDGSHFDPAFQCGLCLGSGSISAAKADWWNRGKAHYKARVARRETVRECAMRLGFSSAELSGMEHGRIDPAPLEKAA